MFFYVLLYWEDFVVGNVIWIFNKYCDDYCMFNDDIQGIVVVVVVVVLSVVKLLGILLNDYCIVIYGVGLVGIGIVNLLVQFMVSQGVDEKMVCFYFWGFGFYGLLCEGLCLCDFQ